MDLEQKLVQELSGKPGQKALELAGNLGVDRRAVSRLLNRLGQQFEQDAAYRWWPLEQLPARGAEGSGTGSAKTPLARLCRYYLDCLGQEDASEISAWARSRHGYDYVSLSEAPTNGIGRLLREPRPASLLSAMQRDRGSKVLYLGYPININRIVSRRGERLYRLEPVLFLPIEFERPNHRGAASLPGDYPTINPAVIKRYSNADDFTLADELLQLENELGFSNTYADAPELDEVAQRLFRVRNEWPWREACDGSSLPETPPVHELEEAGIYNRAVLVVVERKPYTQGLEHELGDLARLKASDYERTALGRLVNNNFARGEDATGQEPPLLEVLPMNTEQRLAIHRALTEPLTIITGPPGTGKSQVVSNLLVNATWQKKKVLFTSKNNKAVDVVETRVNSLGPRPILLRAGANDYLQRLSEYVQDLLSATTEPGQVQDYDNALAAHQELVSKVADIDSSLDQVIDLRNRVDGREQAVESLRSRLGDKVFQFVRKNLDTDFEGIFKSFFTRLARADKSRQNRLERLLWPLLGKSRMRKAVNTLAALDGRLSDIGLSMPFRPDKDVEFEALSKFSEQVKGRLRELEKIADYFQLLHDFQVGESLESLNREQRQRLEDIAENSNRLWASWLHVIPATPGREGRKLLSQYLTVIRMIIETQGKGTTASIWRQFHSLGEKMSRVLPCWAVTSLSTRGRLPFIAGYYDLVVFDEASQCDIASALPLLYRAKRAVIIGDPQQLTHISKIQKRLDQQLLDRFELVTDFVHWSYSSNSLFDMARAYAPGEATVDLRDHHRSHADIINFSNRHFYNGRLRVATRYDGLKTYQGYKRGEPGVRWIDVKGQTVRPGTGSAINRQEASAVVAVLERLLLKQGYLGSIGVVSPFRSQANLVRELCARNDALQQALDDAGFLSDTVHRFQGDERDLIIFSPVISRGAPDSSLNFLEKNGNLFNVAITRARAMLLVVGDQAVTGSCGVEYLEKFAQYVAQLSTDSSLIRATEQGIEYGPKYPGAVDRSKVSDWEVFLYEALYQAGIKTIPQYSIEQYVLDLAIVDRDRRLDIEVDGEHYHRNWTGELCRRDQLRNQRLYELGWDVLRFWVYQVRDETDFCVDKVNQWLEKSR